MNSELLADAPQSSLRTMVRRSVIVSIVMIIAGIFAIVAPMAAGIAVNLMVGWLLLFTGAAHFVFAWSAGRAGGAISDVLLGLLYGVVGAYLLMNPLVGLMALTLALGLYLFAESILEFISCHTNSEVLPARAGCCSMALSH